MADTENPAMKPAEPDVPKDGKKEEDHRRYTLVPFPKIVFFYPLMFISIGCGIMQIISRDAPEVRHVAGSIFLIIFLINVLVISFDFPGVKALAMAMGVMALVFGVILLNQHMSILAPLSRLMEQLYARVEASSAFYFVISAILFVMIMGGILGNVLWNKWTIEAHRLRHKDGLFSYREYPVIDLQVDKEVDDVFEFVLLQSGTLTFRIPSQSFRLENVPFITRAQRRIQSIVRKTGSRE